MKLLLKQGQIFRDGTFHHGDVAVEGRLVEKIAPDISPFGYDHVIHLNDMYIVPGFIDVHLHLREPGFSMKETMATGTLAAARGGYTTVCAMPNVNPPPDSPEHVCMQRDLIAKHACMKVLPYGTITMGQRGEGQLVDFETLAPLVFGFSDDGRGVQSEETMREAMRCVKRVGGFIAAHCEDDTLLHGGYIHDGEYARAHGHAGICSESEWGQVARDLRLVRETGCRYHVCHVSTKESVQLLRQAKAEGLPVTAETAPHYLLLTDADLQEHGRFKMNPPIRAAEDRDALIEGLLDGTIDVIATDHAPHTAEEKGRGLKGSLMGVVGLETAFPVLYTGLVQKGILSLATLITKMSVAPGQIFGLGSKIAEGHEADIAVLDLAAQYRIDPATFASKGRSTPFDGMEVTGRNTMTIVGGKIAWQA